MSKYRITMNGKVYEMVVELINENDLVAVKQNIAGPIYHNSSTNVQIINPDSIVQTEINAKIVKSPMPGTIIKILVETGTSVKKGDPLMVLEAMKMENEIQAACDGIIKNVFVVEGQTVMANGSLIELE